MEDNLPVHVILGAADIQRIKTTEPAVLGVDPDIDPGAEYTITGKLTPLSAETEKGCFLNSSQGEFEQMCSQEVLGLTGKADVQQLFHEEFKDHVWMMEHIQQGCHGNQITPLCLQTN